MMRFPWTKPEPEPTVTLEDIIQSWPLFLAAGGSPTLEWFMALDLEVQEALADIGMRWREQQHLELGAVLADPKLAQHVMEAEDTDDPGEAAATLLQHVLADAASRMTGAPGASTGQSAAPAAPSSPPSWDQLERGSVQHSSGPQKRDPVRMPGGDR